jgi:hypothetical protein
MATQREQEFLHTQDVEKLPSPDELPQLKLISHSRLFYWWPAWVAGYIIALITWVSGQQAQIPIEGQDPLRVWIYPNAALGLTFVLILLAVIVFTNISFRGWASFGLMGAALFVAMFLAWMDWWDEVMALIPQMRIFVNLGFYLTFSTILLVLWLGTFFVYDRLHYFLVKPGQLTEEYIVGEAGKSYDTRGMLLEKHAEDVFRHMLLGLGSGDLNILTSGARNESLTLRNVLFIDSKLSKIKRLLAVKPDDLLKEQED